jgi:hypothetical protein
MINRGMKILVIMGSPREKDGVRIFKSLAYLFIKFIILQYMKKSSKTAISSKNA